jgi:hypothetical protein
MSIAKKFKEFVLESLHEKDEAILVSQGYLTIVDSSEIRIANGTSFSGHMLRGISYDQLISLFGEPVLRGGDKTQVEWIGILHGVESPVFTIYDWKEIVPPEQVDIWHIGSKTKSVGDEIVHLVYSSLMNMGEASKIFSSLEEISNFFKGDISWITPEMLKGMGTPEEIRKFFRKNGMNNMFGKT